MRRVLLLLAALAAPVAVPARPAGAADADTLRACILGASSLHGVPPFAMVLLLAVEGGRLGMRSPNTNGTGDLGPFQVNEIWVKDVARYWGVEEARAHELLRTNLCANAEAAAWIFGRNLRSAGGDLWRGVAQYHSMNPHLQALYLGKVLRATRWILKPAAEKPKGAPRG